MVVETLVLVDSPVDKEVQAVVALEPGGNSPNSQRASAIQCRGFNYLILSLWIIICYITKFKR
jgi:hypothetical protein